LTEALERDLAARYDRAMRRSFFPETTATDEYGSVADIACEPPYTTVAPALRRTIILRAARSAAVRGTLEKAEELLAVAQTLPGGESVVAVKKNVVPQPIAALPLLFLRRPNRRPFRWIVLRHDKRQFVKSSFTRSSLRNCPKGDLLTHVKRQPQSQGDHQSPCYDVQPAA
jgi:hypothetical protein